MWNGKIYYLGSWGSAEQAARAYDQAAICVGVIGSSNDLAWSRLQQIQFAVVAESFQASQKSKSQLGSKKSKGF